MHKSWMLACQLEDTCQLELLLRIGAQKTPLSDICSLSNKSDGRFQKQFSQCYSSFNWEESNDSHDMAMNKAKYSNSHISRVHMN